MSKTNCDHLQFDLFDLFSFYPKIIWKQMKQPEEYYSYQLIFSKIMKKAFSVLFSTKNSCPNIPINVLLAGLILMNRYQWSYGELFK